MTNEINRTSTIAPSMRKYQMPHVSLMASHDTVTGLWNINGDDMAVCRRALRPRSEYAHPKIIPFIVSGDWDQINLSDELIVRTEATPCRNFGRMNHLYLILICEVPVNTHFDILTKCSLWALWYETLSIVSKDMIHVNITTVPTMKVLNMLNVAKIVDA